MIKKLVLQNFQAHSSSLLTFEPGVNVLHGPSDTGKSSVIRALRWLAFNRPAGDTFIRHGTKEALVQVDTDRGEVARYKSKSKNVYRVNGEDQNAPGANVPEPVGEILQLDEINFQGQHDAPFLLSESAGQVGRILNEMVDLEVIDRTLLGLNRRNREAVRQADFTQERTETTKGLLEGYEGVDEALALVESAREVDRMNRERRKSLTALSALLRTTETQQGVVAALPDTSSMGKAIERARIQADVVKKTEDRVRSLRRFLEDLGQAFAEVQTRDRELIATTKSFKAEMGKECPLCHQPLPQS